MKYEFDMPETPYESNCRVCPLMTQDDNYKWCALQEENYFEYRNLTEKEESFAYMSVNMGCPLEVVK